MDPRFNTIALIGKYKSPATAGPLQALAGFLRARGVRVLVDPLSAQHLPGTDLEVAGLDQVGTTADLAIVIGGDGTMLNIARRLAPYDVALVGVNQGRLGFLTDVSMETMLDTVAAILAGEFVEEPRMLLEAWVDRGGRELEHVLAFNDAGIGKGEDGGLIELEVRIDGRFVYNLRADGLVVASPTGSTAYALSAGGPILHPTLDAIALVPVCPHTLSNRPIAVSAESLIEVIMHRCASARVHFDSHSHVELADGDRVVVRRFARSIRLLHPVGHDYFHMLREKLHWSESL